MAKKNLSKNVLDSDPYTLVDEPVGQENRATGDKIKETTQAYGFFDEMPDEGMVTTSQLEECGDVISLGTELTIKSVASCKAQIERTLGQGFEVKISAAKLQKIDTAGLQLLYSLKKTLQKSAQVIQWESTNPVINRAANRIGLQDIYEDPQQDAGYGFF